MLNKIVDILAHGAHENWQFLTFIEKQQGNCDGELLLCIYSMRPDKKCNNGGRYRYEIKKSKLCLRKRCSFINHKDLDDQIFFQNSQRNTQPIFLMAE